MVVLRVEHEAARDVLSHKVAIVKVSGCQGKEATHVGSVLVNRTEMGALVPMRASKEQVATGSAVLAASRQAVVGAHTPGHGRDGAQDKTAKLTPD
jgi:hypothetical protein